MKIGEIILNESDTNKLGDLLEVHNKGLKKQNQQTYQEYAKELLCDAIYYKWKVMKSI